MAGEDDKIIPASGEYEFRDGAKNAAELVRDFLPDADIIDIGEAAFEVYEGRVGATAGGCVTGTETSSPLAPRGIRTEVASGTAFRA